MDEGEGGTDVGAPLILWVCTWVSGRPDGTCGGAAKLGGRDGGGED